MLSVVSCSLSSCTPQSITRNGLGDGDCQLGTNAVVMGTVVLAPRRARNAPSNIRWFPALITATYVSDRANGGSLEFLPPREPKQDSVSGLSVTAVDLTWYGYDDERSASPEALGSDFRMVGSIAPIPAVLVDALPTLLGLMAPSYESIAGPGQGDSTKTAWGRTKPGTDDGTDAEGGAAVVAVKTLTSEAKNADDEEMESQQRSREVRFTCCKRMLNCKPSDM